MPIATRNTPGHSSCCATGRMALLWQAMLKLGVRSEVSPLPSVMSGVLLTGHGGFDRLVYRTDLPVPMPGAGEVLVRVRAAGVNNTDINLRTGWYSKSLSAASAAGEGDDLLPAPVSDAGWTGAPLDFPRIQGADACGEIVAVGAQVDTARLGERVIVEPVFQRPPGGPGLNTNPVYFGSDCPGAFAEYVSVPSINAHCIETSLTDAELASFPCSYSTAENMLTRAGVRAGEVVLITGASGGVGSAAVQLARRRGARVTAVAASGKAAEIEHLGAARVLHRDADIVQALGSGSVDVVLDVVGGGHFPALLQVLRRGGRYAVAGAIAGPMVQLDLRTLYLNDLRLFGCTIPEPGTFAALVGYIVRGEIRPLIARTYPLTAIADAQRDFLSKQNVGKIILVPGK
jgi:NADPH:quinone reductase-like Zn-dependent oxidoreductase